MKTCDIVRCVLILGAVLYVSMKSMIVHNKPAVSLTVLLLGALWIGLDIYYSLKRNAKSLEFLIGCLENSTSRAERLVQLNQLSREAVADLEQMTVATYKALELATYKSGKDLRKPEHANHPLRFLWNRWEACSDRVGEITDQFLASKK